MKTRLSTLLVVGLMLAVPATAQEPEQMFDFYGHAIVPTGEVGQMLTLYSTIQEGGSPTVETPLPLDFDNYDYTLVITDLELVNISGSPFIQTFEYAGGTIAIYEDNATVADYDNAPATFVDGTAILTGVVDITRTVFVMQGSVAGGGFVDWTGGTRLNDFAIEDQTGWPFLCAYNADDAWPGYDEAWDGKVEPTDPIVSTEDISWGSLKSLY